MKSFFIFSLVFQVPFQTQAIEMQNPATLCERFLTSTEKSQCETEMKKLQPDWYLAGICNKQFEDTAFYDCIHLSKSAQFSLEKLDACDQTETTDEGRLTCVKGSMVSGNQAVNQAYQSVTPKSKKAHKSSSLRVSDGY